MKKISNPLYQYRYGSKEEIKEILLSTNILQQERLHKNLEMCFEPISIYYLCAELLEMAQIPENPYSLQILQKKYEQVQSENKEGFLFTFEELFSEGWLQSTAEEWLWNNTPCEYERLTFFHSQKEKEIVMFLQSLNRTPYVDEIYPYIKEESIEFNNLLNKTGISVEQLIEKKLLIREENVLCLNTFSREWEIYGERVLSRKYEEWNCAEYPQKLEKWIHYCKFFTRCWKPEKYIDEKEELFQYCIEKLEREISSWEQECMVISKAIQVSSNKLQEKYEITIPESGIERQRFVRCYFERWCRLWDGNSQRSIYYGICKRNYAMLGNEMQQRFREILKKPYFELQYFYLNPMKNISCTIDCVEDVELFFPAVCNLFDYIIDNNKKNELKHFYFKLLAKPIWNVCYNGLHQSNKTSWVEKLIELWGYLYDKGDCYRNSLHSKTFTSNYTELLVNLLEFYFNDITEIEQVDEEVISCLVKKISSAEDHSAQRYFGVLLVFGKYGEYYIESENREQTILDGLFKGLMVWINLAKENKLLLSTINWEIFSEGVWHEILIQKQELLEELFSMLNMQQLENSTLYNQNKSVILGVGRLALLELYFKALCLTELRDELSVHIKECIEDNFINEFILCQNKWRLFSGENIRLADSLMILSKCMQVFSFLSEDSKKYFIEKIKLETAIDVAFWLEYIRDQYVKSELLRILMTAQKEKLFERIHFFPTWQHAVDNLLDLCFSELESEEENNKEVEKMLEFAEYALKDFEDALSHKPETIRKDYKEWQESAYCRIMLLRNQKEELLSSKHDFYKGIVWLNSDKLEDIQKAKAIFLKNNEGSVSCRSNYLVAYVLEIIKKKELSLDYSNELRNYEKEFSSYISVFRNIYLKELYIVYLYSLYLYLSLDKEIKFWAVYEQMPKEFRQDKKISNYVIEVYLSSGKVTEAKRQLEQLQLIYGETAENVTLQKRIETIDTTKRQIKSPYLQGYSESNERSHYEMRLLLFGLSQRPNYFLAEMLVDEDEFYRLKDKKINDKQEIQLLSMVCNALKSLQNYSVNLLHKGNVSTEDVYNRTLKLFFNLREERFLGFRLDEQTQGGTTKTIYQTGEQGVGRRDLLLVRKERAVALLEGIRLKNIERKQIEEHIGKLREYNVERVPIVIMPIYGYMSDEKKFWEKYVKLLCDLKEESMYDIIEIEDVNEFLETEFSSGLQYIVRTKHNYHEFDVVVYHIMINITGK